MILSSPLISLPLRPLALCGSEFFNSERTCAEPVEASQIECSFLSSNPKSKIQNPKLNDLEL
jgi:hypothetical protein